MSNELRVLKVQRTKLLNKAVKTVEQFTEIQDKLNEIELRIKQIESEENNIKRYKVIMEGINPRDNLVIGTGLTIEQAEELKKEYKEKDYKHYYEIYLMEGDK